MAEKILITGGSGYIATYLTAQLLKMNTAVRVTVRSQKRIPEIKDALADLNQADLSKLEVVSADLSSNEGWPKAMQGITRVLHVASPFPTTEPKTEDEVIIPAKEGTLRILKAAHNAGVKSVVMTSAFGAVGMGYTKAESNHIFTEKDWSNMTPNSKLSAYYKSKLIAEQAAWEYVKKEAPSLHLTTMLPVAVMGPVIGKRITGSNLLINMMLNGSMPAVPDVDIPIVDVRDVVDANINALTNPSAIGERFILSNNSAFSLLKIAKILHNGIGSGADKAPKHQLPSWFIRLIALFSASMRSILPDLGIRRKMTSAKAKKLLNWQPKYAPEQTILVTANSILNKHQ